MDHLGEAFREFGGYGALLAEQLGLEPAPQMIELMKGSGDVGIDEI
jgi:hypothetical protein